MSKKNKNKNKSIIKSIFSVTNENTHKIISVFGIKIKLKNENMILKKKIRSLKKQIKKQNLIIKQTIDEKNSINKKISYIFSELYKTNKSNNIAFSVIMATYNRAFCIENAINSLLNQTYPNYELIIVDDGSTDNTQELIKTKYSKEIKSGKIVYKYCNTNEGASIARNEGLKMAKNEWIAYLDSDNVMFPNHLEEFVYAISQNNNLTYYAQFIRSDGQNWNKPFDYNSLLQYNYIDMGVFVHHKSLVAKYGDFDPSVKRFDDWDLIIRYTKDNTPIYIQTPVLKYNCSKNINRLSTEEGSFEKYLSVMRNKHKTSV